MRGHAFPTMQCCMHTLRYCVALLNSYTSVRSPNGNLAQAGQPPYSLPPSVADDAKAVFVEMGQKGHTRSMLSYNWLILTQVHLTVPFELKPLTWINADLGRSITSMNVDQN